MAPLLPCPFGALLPGIPIALIRRLSADGKGGESTNTRSQGTDTAALALCCPAPPLHLYANPNNGSENRPCAHEEGSQPHLCYRREVRYLALAAAFRTPITSSPPFPMLSRPTGLQFYRSMSPPVAGVPIFCTSNGSSSLGILRTLESTCCMCILPFC